MWLCGSAVKRHGLLHDQIAVLDGDSEHGAGGHIAGNELFGNEGLHGVLQIAAQRTGTERGIIAAVDDLILGLAGEPDRDLLGLQTLVQIRRSADR